MQVGFVIENDVGKWGKSEKRGRGAEGGEKKINFVVSGCEQVRISRV